MRDNPDGDDDADWLELMRGRDAPNARSTTRAEAAWFRAALFTYRSKVPSGQVPDPAQRVETLVTKAVAAGVLHPTVKTRSVFRFSRQTLGRWVPRPALALAGTLAGVTILWFAVGSVGVERDHEPIMRGGPLLHSVEATDPAAEQDRYRRELESAGFVVVAYVTTGRYVLELQVPLQLTAAQLEATRRLKLPQPDGSRLRLEFERP
jgi:hypothetical protein